MFAKKKKAPIRDELRLAYCVDGCSSVPVEHRWRLYSGKWKVRCLNCLHERIIQTILGIGVLHPSTQEKGKTAQKPVVMAEVFLAMIADQGIPPEAENGFDVDWLARYLGLNRSEVRPSYVAYTLRRWGIIKPAKERGRYQWVA